MTKKKLLYIVPHDFYPPKGGGALRVYHILKNISPAFDVTLVYFSDSENIEEVKCHFNDIRIFQYNHQIKKTKVDRLKQSIKHFAKIRSIKPLKNETTYLIKLFESELKDEEFDIVFLEHLESYSSVLPLFNSHFRKAKKIINLHNIDHELWLDQYKQEPNEKKYLTYSKTALRLEKTLKRNIDHVLVCSKTDADKINKLNSNSLNVTIIPNGTKIIKKIPSIKKDVKQLLFVGSLDYFPNIQGLKWFYNEVFPIILEKIPDIKINIVGKSNNYAQYDFIKHSSFQIIGEVPDVSPYYFNSGISIVPLLHGSGTRLKIPESMAHKTPVVSTSKGAEGNLFIHETHLLLADTPDDFAESIIKLIQNDRIFQKLLQNSFELVKKEFDWISIGDKVKSILHTF